APQTGTVAGTEALLNACLPPVEPITIKPLEAPAPGEGVQFVLPTVHLPHNVEQEVCFATYYDVSAQVPTDMQDPSGRYFRYSTPELRLDAQSHEPFTLYEGLPTSQVPDPSFRDRDCDGGDNAGNSCGPTDPGSFPSGFCRSQVTPTGGCVGYGPAGSGVSV